MIPCPFPVWNKLCFLGVGSLIPEGWIFGVFVGKRKQKIPCAAESFSLFLVPGAGNSLLLSALVCPARGGAGGCSAPFSVPPQAVNPAQGVDAWLLLASGSRTRRENAAEQSDVLEEGEKCVRSKEKSALPRQ